MDVNAFRPKTYLLEIYLKYLDKKIEKGKHDKTEYVIFLIYLGLIILTIVTLTINDLETRLMLFDITIPFGSHRIYNTILSVIFEIYGLALFKYIHLTTDKKIMFWTEIVDIYRQKYSRSTIPFKLLITDLPKIIKLAEIFKTFCLLFLIYAGK